MKFLHTTSALLAVCLTAMASNLAGAVSRSLCESGDTPSSMTPSMTPDVTLSPTTTTPAPTTPAPTTPAPTTPAPTTPAPITPAPTTAAPRVASVTFKSSITSQTASVAAPSYRICYNLAPCSSTGFDQFSFYNFDVFGGANVLVFLEAGCPIASWDGYITTFRDMEGQADIRNAPSGKAYKSFVVQAPGDTSYGPSYTTKAVCTVV